MKKLSMMLGAALAALSLGAAAHGDAKPLHGGVVQVVSDVAYELVAQPNGAALYVVDHGKPVDVARMSGKLTVLAGAQKTEAELKSAGGNKLEATNVVVGSGAKVVASLKGGDGKTASVRFSLK